MKTTNPNKIARTAGALYLLLIPLGILGIMYVPTTLFVAEDIAATIKNITANKMLFRAGIVSALLVQVVNIFVVLFLYKLLKPVSKFHAMLMMVFILVGAPIALINELNYVAVLHLINSANQSPELIALFLDLHKSGIFIAQIFWGLWLFPMGYLIYKSGFLPKIIGILLMVGCFGYLIDSFNFFLFPNFEITVSEFTFIGELLFPLWLVFKGVKVEPWEKWNK